MLMACEAWACTSPCIFWLGSSCWILHTNTICIQVSMYTSFVFHKVPEQLWDHSDTDL